MMNKIGFKIGGLKVQEKDHLLCHWREIIMITIEIIP